MGAAMHLYGGDSRRTGHGQVDEWARRDRPVNRVVIGARAQLIKMVPVMVALRARGPEYNFAFLCQHTETVDQRFVQFAIKPPDWSLGKRRRDVTSALAMVPWPLRACSKVCSCGQACSREIGRTSFSYTMTRCRCSSVLSWSRYRDCEVRR